MKGLEGWEWESLREVVLRVEGEAVGQPLKVAMGVEKKLSGEGK